MDCFRCRVCGGVLLPDGLDNKDTCCGSNHPRYYLLQKIGVVLYEGNTY